MAANETDDESRSESSNPSKIDFSAYWLVYQEMSWKDPKKIGVTVAAVLILLVPLNWMFGGSSSVTVPGAGAEVIAVSTVPAIAYVPLNSGKSTEFMATINEQDKILTFAAVLGIEKEDLRADVEMSMAPLLSEVLRFMSDKTRDEILDMIRDEEGRERGRLLSRLNQVLAARGVNLEAKGMVVSISFTRYFFPPM